MINLNDLYELQYKLDDYILSKQDNPPKDLLSNTVVALLVEVGELANTTRCFKHWSNKGMMEREIVLDEFSDVLHFYLSIGNQVDETFKFKDNADIVEKDLTVQFLEIYSIITLLDTYDNYFYHEIGNRIFSLGYSLGFDDTEIEGGYIKRAYENYIRQKDGY